MERPERPSRHKSSSRLRNQNRRYHLFSDTDSDMEVETGTIYDDIRRYAPVVCSGLLGSSNMSIGESSTSNTVPSVLPEPRIFIETDRAMPSQPLSMHEVDNSRDMLNAPRRRRVPPSSQSTPFVLPETLLPPHNIPGSSVDSSSERSGNFRTSCVTLNCYTSQPHPPVTKRYRTANGTGISTDIIDGPTTSRIPDQPNSSTSEPDIGLLQVGSDTEGDTPAEPSNQYRPRTIIPRSIIWPQQPSAVVVLARRRRLGFASSCDYWDNPQNTVEPINLTARSPPFRDLQNQGDSEFLRRLDEITFDTNPARIRLSARRRIISPSLSHETLDQDGRSDQEPSLAPPLSCQNISTLRQDFNTYYPLTLEGDDSSRDTEINVHNVEGPEASESGRQSGDIIILSTPERQSPPIPPLPQILPLPASPQIPPLPQILRVSPQPPPPPQSPVEHNTLLSTNERYTPPQSPSYRSSQSTVTSGEQCPLAQSLAHQVMTSTEPCMSATQSQRSLTATVNRYLPPNSSANLLPSSSGTSEQKDEVKDSNVSNFQELNHNLVSLLECPVCLDYMVPPIYQCSKGHIVCVTCRPKLILCPTCRSRFADRNLAMEKVAEKLMYPCKNVVTGCTVTLHLKDKVAHEESCGFRHYQCISSHCQWKGYKPELVVHMTQSHSDKIIIGINQVVSLSLCPIGVHFDWILSALNEVFQVSFLTDISEKLLIGTVYYVGPPEKASKFYYTFCIRHHTDPYNSIEYTHRTHIDTLKASSLVSSHDCFSITLDVARTYRASRSSNLLPIVVSVHATP